MGLKCGSLSTTPESHVCTNKECLRKFLTRWRPKMSLTAQLSIGWTIAIAMGAFIPAEAKSAIGWTFEPDSNHFVLAQSPTDTPALNPSLPPATFPVNQTDAIEVPDINPISTPPTTPPEEQNRDALPRNPSSAPMLNQSDDTSIPIAPPPNGQENKAGSPRLRVIEFGQPLPTPTGDPLPQNNNVPPPQLPVIPQAPIAPEATGTTQRSQNKLLLDLVLPAGSLLNLRYPGSQPLKLTNGIVKQEVLLLNETLRDRTGKIVAIAGTQIIGRFESDRDGIRFITQAIALNGKNMPLAALLKLAPNTAAIQPNQILAVPIAEDLRLSGN